MISIFADLPRTSSATTVTPIGEVIRRTLWLQTSLISESRVPRDRDRSIRANGDQIERRRDAAALDEVADELGEAFLIEPEHAGIVAQRRELRLSGST